MLERPSIELANSFCSSSEITYIRMYRGWLYLIAIMDWFSRYVIAWELSVTLEADFCVKALGYHTPDEVYAKAVGPAVALTPSPYGLRSTSGTPSVPAALIR